MSQMKNRMKIRPLKEKAEKKPVEIPKKTEPQKNGAVKKGEQHPIPQAKKRETPAVKIEPERRNDEPSVPADWKISRRRKESRR